MAEKIVYLNGSFVPESEAKVSVLDAGFNAGDGVYDVTRTFGHKPFRLRDHTGDIDPLSRTAFGSARRGPRDHDSAQPHHLGLRIDDPDREH